MVRTKPGLLEASGLLFAIIMAVNVCNYVFHALASRMLGPEDYGSLVSMLAVLGVLAIPSQAVQAVMARTAAVEELAGRHDRIAALTGRALWQVGLLAAGLCAALGLSSAFWARFFQQKSAAPLLAVGAAGLVSLLLPVARGLLQGFQRFGHLGLNLFADGVLRLGFGAAAFLLGFGVTGGLLAGAASGAVALCLAFLPSRYLSHQPRLAEGEMNWAGLYGYGTPVLVAFGAFAVLSGLDVMLVKHFFPPLSAGYYSAASVVGKAFFFLPLAIAQVLFPKVSAGHAQAESTLGLLHKSLWLTAGLLAAGAVAAWLVAPLIVATLFGARFLNPETLTLVRLFGPAISPLALVYVLAQYNLAVRHLPFAWLLAADIPVLFGALLLFHSGLEQVLLALGANHLLLLLVGYGVTLGGAHVRVIRPA